MDGRIVYSASPKSLQEEHDARIRACRYHVVDATTRKIRSGHDKYDDAASQARANAQVWERPYLVVDTQAEPSPAPYVGDPYGAKRVGWLKRLFGRNA